MDARFSTTSGVWRQISYGCDISQTTALALCFDFFSTGDPRRRKTPEMAAVTHRPPVFEQTQLCSLFNWDMSLNVGKRAMIQQSAGCLSLLPSPSSWSAYKHTRSRYLRETCQFSRKTWTKDASAPFGFSAPFICFQKWEGLKAPKKTAFLIYFSCSMNWRMHSHTGQRCNSASVSAGSWNPVFLLQTGGEICRKSKEFWGSWKKNKGLRLWRTQDL